MKITLISEHELNESYSQPKGIAITFGSDESDACFENSVCISTLYNHADEGDPRDYQVVDDGTYLNKDQAKLLYVALGAFLDKK